MNANTAPNVAASLMISMVTLVKHQEHIGQELPVNQLAVLTRLASSDMSPGELAEAAGVRPPSMTRALAALGNRGLISISDHPEDGRRAVVGITDIGRAELNAAPWDAQLTSRIRGLDETQRRALSKAVPVLAALCQPGEEKPRSQPRPVPISATYTQRQRDYRAANRRIVLAHYSPTDPPSCACCGTTGGLGVDHIAGDGAQHRRECSMNLYRWLIRHNFPPGYQVLCSSCNSSKSMGERCRLNHNAA
jgi:DNA-binding MarR family transcriptional regulator